MGDKKEGEENESKDEDEHKLNDVLPDVDKSFCFVRDEFVSMSFCVDDFVKNHRKKVSLEKLREDLTQYLRVLKLSMIELINEDYNDFVNLSSNLVGLDKLIANLYIPLNQLKDNALSVHQTYDDIITKVNNKVNKLNDIRKNKKQLAKMIACMNGLEKAEKWSNHLSAIGDDDDMDSFSCIEKISLLLSQTQVDLKSLNSEIPLVSMQIKPRIEAMAKLLSEVLESNFCSAITNSDKSRLECILRIYSLNGKQSDLENLFRQRMVRPYMNEVICENYLEKHGVKHFFDEILEFIELKCQLLLCLENKSFNFMVNSVWAEITNCLVVRTLSLFSPGNPDDFHLRYHSTVDFVQNFKSKCKLSDAQLENGQEYSKLMAKFNTEVYFHIRFKDIATSFESTLEENPYGHVVNNGNNLLAFRLVVNQSLYDCITKCWCTKKIFISHLFPSFWKLTLQLISRYTVWLQSLQDFENKPATFNNGITHDSIQNKLSNQSIFLCLLVGDCQCLVSKLQSFYELHIKHLKPKQVDEHQLKQSFNEAIDSLNANGLSNIVNLIKLCLINQCDAVLKQVNDVPRLYRKTNRDVPVKASNYINKCIDLIKLFITSVENQSWNSLWTQEVLEEITSHFKQFTSEVLTSVQKIEDSLKRLKKAKIGNQNSQVKNNSSMTDDDKIRLQIIFDVEAYEKQIEEKLGINKESIKSLMELHEMANTTRNLIN